VLDWFPMVVNQVLYANFLRKTMAIFSNLNEYPLL